MGERVLVVDDEAGIRAVMARGLAAAGYETGQACDGEEALRALEVGPVDIVLIDIIMPNKEGVETIMEIKRRWPATYVIAMSGGGRISPDLLLTLASELGADRTLAKPFKIQDLVSALQARA